ncbi:autotransporter-associated beta strand repeat-containing protein [bacterium]|nr:autotransporter-associated beta strand repeat-containing protein [bacterium]
MKKIITLLTLIATTFLFAADGSWSATNMFPSLKDWSDNTAWAGGTIASGAGSTAYFTNGIDTVGVYGIKAITMATAPTIENVVFDLDVNDPTALYVLAGGTLTLLGTPTINVSTKIAGAYIGFPGFGGSLAGTAGFTKLGPGRLVMAQPSLISGTVTISDGNILITDNNALTNADITVNDGKRLYIANGVAMNSGDITIESGGRIHPEFGNGAFTVNANIIAKGEHAYEGAGGDSTNNLNGIINLDSAAWAGVTIAGSGVLNINNNIIGTGDLHILGHSASGLVQIININEPGYYTGNDTRLAAWASSPRFELNCINALSNSNLTIANNTYTNNGPVNLVCDLNGNTQLINQFSMDAGLAPLPGQSVELTAGTEGGIKVLNWAHAYNGKCIISGGNHQVTPYFGINAGAELILTNTYVNTSSEFLIWGANATMTINNGATARNFVARFAEAPTVTTLNINKGGKLETARIWTATANPATTSLLNFNGGIISDGAEGEHEGSFTNWFSAGQSNVVMAGGAFVEVNNLNGREIWQPFYHDSALGATEDGGLTKLGEGTLKLHGANNYTGPTIVSNGTLILAGLGSSKLLKVADNKNIGGINGSLTIPSGATVVPGNSIGTIWVEGNLNMAEGSIYDWEVTAGKSADLIYLTDNLDLPSSANSVTVNVYDSSAILESDTNILFTFDGVLNGDVSSIFLQYSGEVTGPENPVIAGQDVLVGGIVIPEPAMLGIFILAVILFRKIFK